MEIHYTLPRPVSWSKPRYQTDSILLEDKMEPRKSKIVCTPFKLSFPPLLHCAPTQLLFSQMTEKWIKHEILRLNQTLEEKT